MSNRPAQVEQQIARVQQLQAEMLEGAKPLVDDNNVNDEDTNTPTPPTDPVAPVVVADPPATVSKADYDRLEQTYRTLQGMHKADVSRMRGELDYAHQAIQDLENRIVVQEKANKASSYTPAKYVTAEDEEEYGDTLGMMRRAAREEAENATHKREQALLERIAQMEAALGNVQNTVVPKLKDIEMGQQEQIKAEFWGAVTTNVPDWRTINAKPEFVAWLAEEDPVTGASRQQFLDYARNTYNAPRVIKFFEEYKRTAGGQTPAPRNNTQAQLERMVAPNASRVGGTQTPPDKKIWTRADVTDFYADINKGKYANKLEERKKIENDLFLAQSEGRVVA